MRRKIVRKTKASGAQDDKKLQGALKKLNVQPIPGVEEVNMFREDGNVLHFTAPKGETSRLRVRRARARVSRGHTHVHAGNVLADSHTPCQFTPLFPQTPSLSTAPDM